MFNSLLCLFFSVSSVSWSWSAACQHLLQRPGGLSRTSPVCPVCARDGKESRAGSIPISPGSHPCTAAAVGEHTSSWWGCEGSASPPAPGQVWESSESELVSQSTASRAALAADTHFQLLAACICSGAAFSPKILPMHPPGW